ncbi:hypothetical protein [Flagellimonas lutimaris]|uniref:hypothetical protein n=1 Tax=Flagellimonas lutimaris TaxID=475082 RepID=UPI003F5CBD6B
MKNNRKALLAFIGVGLLLLGACQQGPKKDESTEPTNPNSTQKEPIAPPEGIISLEESKSLYDNYTKNRIGMIEKYEMEQSPDEKHIPSRFTSFTYSDIKQYMAYIEQEAGEAGVDISSLRFYFANYPDKPDFPDGKKVVHPRQNSIFIVPTTIMDGQEYGFYIGTDGKAKPIKDAMGRSKENNTSQASLMPILLQDDGGSLNLNHGSSGPPPDGDF